MSLYLVSGLRDYRGHPPGSKFEAVLDEAAESRAIRRGAIQLIEKSTPRLKEGSYALPKPRSKQKKEEAS
jgi:hypothetical protein